MAGDNSPGRWPVEGPRAALLPLRIDSRPSSAREAISYDFESGGHAEVADSLCFWGPEEKQRRHVLLVATKGLNGRRSNDMMAGVHVLSRCSDSFGD